MLDDGVQEDTTRVRFHAPNRKHTRGRGYLRLRGPLCMEQEPEPHFVTVSWGLATRKANSTGFEDQEGL